MRLMDRLRTVEMALATAMFVLLSVAAPGRAHALVGINTCGPFINSTLRLENVQSTTSSVAFVDLVAVNISVPAGQTRCLKVIFTGEATCRGPTAVADNCFVRALDNGVEINPQGGGAQSFLSEDSTPNAHAYEWASRIGAGNHRIVIQRRVGNAATVFVLDDWTFDVQLLN